MPAKSNSNVDAATNLAFKSLRVTLLGLIFLACNHSYGQSMRVMSRDELRDRIRGAWAAQMIGVSYGAPTEFKTVGKIIEGEIKGDDLSNAIDQDDLYVEMTFAHVMDTIGLDATTSDYGEAFKNTKYKLWHANAAARRNLNRGVKAPMSGHPTFNLHADDIDFQIEADFIGIMCPGLPQESNKYCERVGRVMNYGDGLYGGMFVAGVLMGWFYSFVAQSVRNIDSNGIVEAGKLTPYTAVVAFSLGLFLSNFVWNSILMATPLTGDPVPFSDYFRKGTPRLHLIGVIGGMIWGLGMSFSIIASTAAGPALSYGLGQGATMIGAIWGVLVWKEFKGAPSGTGRLLVGMFLFYLLGLGVLIASKL